MRESKFQRDLRSDLESMFEGCLVLKNDANNVQGVPDLLILWRDRWALLECKRSLADRMAPQPNQEWYVDTLNEMSFAAFIYPENREEVLRDLQRAFISQGRSRVPRSK